MVHDLQASIAEYHRAVSLSPHDFRLWTDLGRALEQSGDFEGSEKALRRAVELAPYYSWPRWHLGNFLLRRGRYDDGLAELRKVAEVDETKRGAIFDLAWMVYGGDIKAVTVVMGNSPGVRAEFIGYLLGRKYLDEALAIWAGLSSEQKKHNAATSGKTLVDGLIAAKRFREALNFSRDLDGGKGTPEFGQIWNGGFESAVVMDGMGLFDWHIQNIPQASAALDPTNPREGKFSLRISFNATAALDFNFTQLVAVEPSGSYRVTFYIRATALNSASTMVVRVLNAADGKLIAESPQVPAGKSDWQQVTLDFKAPPDADGVTLSISRAKCVAEGGVCPIFGTVWYDDFNLQLVGREAGARKPGAGK
ncbi:MAG: tetratricopeptide repeat protein [Acidobacteria bacterium]|nr:tetratricopeptide repeat protein [Acidobacteriota bacterium]